MWEPKTFEDKLIERYLQENPGELFLEVVSGLSEGRMFARKIDAILIPGNVVKVYRSYEYTLDDFHEKTKNKKIHVIEAKRVLNRGVVGQIIVGAELVKRDYQASEVQMNVVCGIDHADIKWVCKKLNINVYIYS